MVTIKRVTDRAARLTALIAGLSLLPVSVYLGIADWRTEGAGVGLIAGSAVGIAALGLVALGDRHNPARPFYQSALILVGALVTAAAIATLASELGHNPTGVEFAGIVRWVGSLQVQ